MNVDIFDIIECTSQLVGVGQHGDGQSGHSGAGMVTFGNCPTTTETNKVNGSIKQLQSTVSIYHRP